MKIKFFTYLLFSLFTVFSVLGQNDITFLVDMNNEISAGNFDPVTQVVFVTGGNANAPQLYSYCDVPMTDGNNDGVYELTRTYASTATIAYKFYIGVPGDSGTNNCDGSVAGYEPALSNTICGVGAFGDRQHIVNSMDAILDVVCYGSCFDCSVCVDGSYIWDGISNILAPKCGSCHLAQSQGGWNFATYTSAVNSGVALCAPVIIPGDPLASGLIDKTQWVVNGGSPSCGGSNMPVSGTPLTVSEFNTISDWILDGAPENCPGPVEITFSVDMNCSGTLDRPPGITGPSFGWCGNCNAMADDSTNVLSVAGDDIWEVTLFFDISLQGTTFEYKYNIGDWVDQENLVDDMVGGASCAPITDFDVYANRTLDIPVSTNTTQSDTYGTCQTCADPPVNVTFQLDLSCSGLTGQPAFESNLNGFCGGCAPMSDDNMDNIWEITYTLVPGDTLEYIFSVDTVFEYLVDDMLAGGSCAPATDFYSFANRVHVATVDQTVTSTYDTCTPCGGCPTTLTLSGAPDPAGTYEADDWIESTSLIGSNSGGAVNYHAGDMYIELQNNFNAEGQVDFNAEIIDCDPGN